MNKERDFYRRDAEIAEKTKTKRPFLCVLCVSAVKTHFGI
jgi:hypothetical protein